MAVYYCLLVIILPTPKIRGGFDDSENENDDNLSDGDEDEVVAQAITVGDYWRYSVFNGSSTAGQYHGCSITYQPYNGSYNPSYGTWTYSAQGTAQDYYGYNRFTFSSGGYVQVNPVGHTTGTGEGYRFMGCSTSWNGLNSYMTSTVGTARYIYNGGINYSSPPTRGFSFSSTNINIYGIFRYCYTIALTNQGSTSYYYVPKGTSFTLPTPSAPTGQKFVSWSGMTGTISNIQQNYNLTAQFESNTVQVNINVLNPEGVEDFGGSASFSVYYTQSGNRYENTGNEPEQAVQVGTTVEIYNVTARDGFRVTQVDRDGTVLTASNGTYSIYVDAGMTIYIRTVWDTSSLVISYNSNGGSKIPTDYGRYGDTYGKTNLYQPMDSGFSGPSGYSFSMSNNIYSVSYYNNTSSTAWINFMQPFDGTYSPGTTYTVVVEVLSFSNDGFIITFTSPFDVGSVNQDVATGQTNIGIGGVGIATAQFTTLDDIGTPPYNLRSYIALGSGGTINATFRISVFTGNIYYNNFTYATVGNTPSTNELPTPTRTGYTFAGWYMEPSFQNRVTAETVITNNNSHVLYAKWEVEEYNVTLGSPNYVTYPYAVGGGPVQYNYVVHETYSNQFGTQVLRVEFTDSNGGGVYFYVPALIEGEEYKWTVDLRLSTATGSQTKHLSSLGHEMNGTIEADLTTSWQTFTHTFTAQFPSHGAFSFVFYANSDLWQAGDVLYIKNCSVQKVSDMTSENALGSISVPFNSQYSNLPTPSRTGYTFDGWQLGVDYGPNGIDNYGSIGVDTGGITRRIYPTKTYTNSIFQVGTIIYFDISWDTGNLTHVDVNDMAVNLSNFTVTSNRCIGKYTITSDQFINTYSFIDFTFDSTQTILSVNNYVVTGGLDYGPNGINNYSIQSFDQGTKRLQLGDSYENSTFKVGSVISFDISWDIGTLNSIDINDIFLGEGDYAISGNRCNGKYTITSTNFIGQFSFIDFNFESAATTITVNKFMVDNIIDSNEIVQVPGNHFLFPIWTINTYRLDVNTYVNSLNIYPNEYNYDFLFDIYFDGELVADDTKDYMNEAVPYNTEITFEIVQGHAGYDFTNITYNRLQATEQNITFNMPANSCEIGVYFVSHVYTATLKYQNGEPDTNLYLKYGVGWFRNSSCTQETTVITIPTRAGYNFGGFYVDENGNGTQTIDNSGMIVVSNTFASNDMIFYAKWEAKNPAYYDEEQGLWYIEMGKYPQTRLGDESVISELDILRESGAVTEFTYTIGNYTLNSYIYNENEYAYFEESNAYYLVEPVKYYLAGDYEEGYGIENGNVTAVTEQIVFVSEWSSTKLSLGDGYTSSTIRTNLNTFVGNSQINSDYLNTNSYTIKNFKDVNGVSTDTTLSADMIISNESEVETVFGDLSAEFSDLVSDILDNNLMYWTRDVGSNLNTAECITSLGSSTQTIMQKILGVRLTANVSTFGCL